MRKAVLVSLLGLLAVGLAGFAWAGTAPMSVQVTDCGFNSKGAYAKVRVNNMLGLTTHHREVTVAFSMPGSHWRGTDTFGASFARVEVPAHGRVTALVQEHFPPHGSFLDGTHADFHVPGRTLYRLGNGFSGTYLTKKFVMAHPELRDEPDLYIETVPDDPQALRCNASLVSEEENGD